MRTQLHHIDAVAQLEAANRRREKEQQEGAKTVEPKAFMPTVKKAGGDTAAEMTQAFMKSANSENWLRFDYIDGDVRISFCPERIHVLIISSQTRPTITSKLAFLWRKPQKRQSFTQI